MRKLFWSAAIATALMGALLLVSGCSRNQENPSSPLPNNPIPNSGNLPGLPGQRLGFYAQSTNFAQYMPYWANPTARLNSRAGWRTMLKEAMGVCDRDNSNGGLADCNQWINGMHDLVIQFDGTSANAVRMTVRTYPIVNPWYSYTYSFPTLEQFFAGLVGFPTTWNNSGVFNPMILNATVWPVNNSQGFEIRAQAPSASLSWNQVLQLQVANGKFEDQQFDFKLFFKAALVADGTMVRCLSQNCGL